MTDKSISFMRSLCMGAIEQDVLFPFPELSDDEKETLHTVADSIDGLLGPLADDFRVWDEKGEMPAEFIDKLKEFGLFGLVIPEDAGGFGLGSAGYSRVLQQLSRHDASVAITVGAHSSIGMRGLLLFGTDEQHERFYPKLATGEMIAAFCLTEPGAGSDAASIKTTAVRDGDDWILNGSKLWITNGGIADFLTVFAKTGGAEERKHMGAFIVTRDMEGVSFGPHEDKMGLRASSTTAVYLDNVRVPAKNQLGDPNEGFKVAMKILNTGRSGLGGGCVGGMKQLIELATKQANSRHQFGKPIGSYGLIKRKLGNMVVDCYASEAAVSVVAALTDRDYDDYSVEAAISKVFATEALWRTADEALQIAGGNGYMREYPYERVVRDSRINRIFEGTNDILRLFIALSAMNDVGQELKELASTLRGIFDHPIKGFGVFSDYALRRATVATGIGHKKGELTGLHPSLEKQADVFEAGTRQLANAVDRILRKHGKHIIGKQLASWRLADIMTDLFVMACVISRVDTSIKNNGSDSTQKELEIAQVFCRRAKLRIERNFADIDDNDDDEIKSLADHALKHERFSWDSI